MRICDKNHHPFKKIKKTYLTMSTKEELIPEPCRNLAGIQAIAKKKQGKTLDRE